MSSATPTTSSPTATPTNNGQQGGGGNPSGGALGQYQTLGLFMYQQGWQYFELGRAATVAWVTFLLIVGLVLAYTGVARWRARREVAR